MILEVFVKFIYVIEAGLLIRINFLRIWIRIQEVK